jgi:hypothetical protein
VPEQFPFPAANAIKTDTQPTILGDNFFEQFHHSTSTADGELWVYGKRKGLTSGRTRCSFCEFANFTNNHPNILAVSLLPLKQIFVKKRAPHWFPSRGS